MLEQFFHENIQNREEYIKWNFFDSRKFKMI